MFPNEGWDTTICDEAMTWLGTPYVPRAYVKGVGCDCGTLLHACYGGIYDLPPMPQDYPVDWAAHSDNERYLDFVMPFVKEEASPVRGGFSLFHLGKAYSHAAIYLGDNKFIHAWGRKGEGAVTITPARVILGLGRKSGNKPKHFGPKE